jgi:hypothetical protein
VTEAEIIERFRDTFADCVGWHEHHLATCVQLEVLRFEVTGEGTFESVLRCPHRAPMGYSVLAEEPDP